MDNERQDERHVDLAKRCLEQLRCDVRYLTEIDKSLLRIRQSLCDHDNAKLEAEVVRQESMILSLFENQERHRTLKREIAAQLNLPEQDASVRVLHGAVASSVATQLQQELSLAEQLVSQIHHTAHDNTAIVRKGMDLLDSVLDCLTENQTAAPRYEASGALEAASRNSVLDANC